MSIVLLIAAVYAVSFIVTLFMMRLIIYGIWGFARRFDVFDWFVCAFWSALPIFSHIALAIFGIRYLKDGWEIMREVDVNDHSKW